MPDKTLSTTLSVTTFSIIAGAETEGSRPWERRMASPSASLGTSPLGKLGTSPAGSVLVGISLPPGAGTSASFGASGSLASLSNVLLKISAIPSFVLSNPLEARNPAHLPSLEGRDSKGRSESDARSGFLKSNVPARVTIRIDANDFTKRGLDKNPNRVLKTPQNSVWVFSGAGSPKSITSQGSRDFIFRLNKTCFGFRLNLGRLIFGNFGRRKACWGSKASVVSGFEDISSPLEMSKNSFFSSSTSFTTSNSFFRSLAFFVNHSLSALSGINQTPSIFFAGIEPFRISWPK